MIIRQAFAALLAATLAIATPAAADLNFGSVQGGAPGPAGADGIACWDLNENGTCDAASEDASGNGTCEAIDCQGPPGAEGAAGQPGVPGYSPNQILGGGGVAWTSGLSVIVSATQYVIGGTVYTAPQTQLTVGAGDEDFERFDLVVVNTDGEAEIVAGTPAATPVTPEIDPATQIQIALVKVAADATEISDVVNDVVYAEHSGEWGTNASGNWDADNTLNPRSGSKAVRANAAAIGSFLRFNKTGGTNFATYDQLVLYLRIASWPSNKNIIVQALNSAGAPHGAAVLLSNNSFGLVASNTTTYQQVVIPVALFQAGGLDTRYLRFQVGGTGAGSLSLFMDDVVMQVGVQQSALASSSMTWRDTWNASASYPRNSVVFHDGSSYVALQASIGVTPGTDAAIWQTIGGAGGGCAVPTRLAKSAAYTILASDWGDSCELSLAATSGSAYTITLPAANAVPAGTRVTVKRKGASNTITVQRAGTDTIYGSTTGATSAALDADGMALTFESDGTSLWDIL